MRVVCEPGVAKRLMVRLLDEAKPFAKYGKCPIKEPNRASQVISSWCDNYLNAWTEIIGKPPRTDYKPEWIVTEAYYTSFEELAKKKQRANFFRAHIAAFAQVCGQLADAAQSLGRASDGVQNEQAVALYCGRMQDLALAAVKLLQSFCFWQDCRFDPCILGSNIQHHREMYQSVLEAWHGMPLREVWPTVSLIRLVIEIRIRHAFDIIGLTVNGHVRWVPVTEVIEAVQRDNEVESLVPWHVIRRIYRWANVYVHTGFKEYPWLAGYAIEVLKQLMCGVVEESGAWSVDNAVRASTGAQERVCGRIIAKYRREPQDDVKVLSFGRRSAIGELLAEKVREL